MKTHLKKFQLLAIICLVLFVAMYIRSTGTARQKEPTLPKVVSEAKGIEVVNVQIKEAHSLVFTVRNNSDKPVTALTLQTGYGDDEDAVTVAGYREGDEPDKIIIKPHETYDVDMPLNYVRPGKSVRVSGVIYADDTGEGGKGTLELMRDLKKHTKSNKTKREGGNPR
jgi:hypothetical protein